MKKIVLIRHGKAAMGGKDHERELDEDGIVQANSLSKKLTKSSQANWHSGYKIPYKALIYKDLD